MPKVSKEQFVEVLNFLSGFGGFTDLYDEDILITQLMLYKKEHTSYTQQCT